MRSGESETGESGSPFQVRGFVSLRQEASACKGPESITKYLTKGFSIVTLASQAVRKECFFGNVTEPRA